MFVCHEFDYDYEFEILYMCRFVLCQVCVERARACAQLGMVAVKDIKEGETLFSIPRKCLLSPETCAEANVLKQGEITGLVQWLF